METTANLIPSAAAATAVIGQPEKTALKAALREWRSALGSEHVLCSAQVLDKYAQTTLPAGNRSLAVLRPQSTAEVCELVKIAAGHRVPIYPISRGKNWGYGDACPTTAGQVIVDLRRMNRILEVNAELAYAVIEPGVTQGQLAKHLEDSNSGLMLDVTGAGPDASIVGNTLERGFGHTPYGDHFAHSCGMEVVLANGEVLNTGFGAFENARAANVFPWGIGPWLDGLFTQSNFGVVTRMCVHLMPRPPIIEAFAIRINDMDQLGSIVEGLRSLRLMETIRSTVHIANDLRVLSTRDPFRQEIRETPSPMEESIRERLRKKSRLGKWNVFGGLYGPAELGRGLRAAVRSTFQSVAKVQFFNRSKLRWLSRAARVLNVVRLGESLTELTRNANAAFDLVDGVPNPEHLSGAYWRANHGEVAASPPLSSRGLHWVSPILPMTEFDCRKVLSLLEEVLTLHRFDPLMTLSTVNSRSLCCVTSIHYDKQCESETKRSLQCYDELLNRLLREGYPPYRVGAPTIGRITGMGGTYWNTIRQLKSQLDRGHVIAPGRYCP